MDFKSTYLLLVLAICIGSPLRAQHSRERYEKRKDSLLKEITHASDTSLATCYYMLAANLAVSEEEAEVYANKALELSDSIDFPRGQIRSLFILGHIKYARAEYRPSIELYKRGIKVAQVHGLSYEVLKGWSYLSTPFYFLEAYDSCIYYNEWFRQEALAQGDSSRLGLAYFRDGEFKVIQNRTNAGIRSQLKAAEIFENIGDSTQLAESLSSIGLTLAKKERNLEALDYYKKSLSLYSKMGNPARQIITLVNANICYGKMGKLDSAKIFLDKALDILGKSKKGGKVEGIYLSPHDQASFEINIKINQASLWIRMEKYREALDTLNRVREKRAAYFNNYFLASLLNTSSKAHVGLENFDQARADAEEALGLFKKINQAKSLLECLEILSRIEEKSGNYVEALEFQKKYQTLKDSINKEKRDGEYQALLLEYETEARERKIAELTQENLEEENQRNILIAALVILAVLVTGIFSYFRIRNRKNRQLLEQERELDRMKSRFFTQLSHELRTPLTLILGPLDQLIDQEESPLQKEKLYLMRRNAHRLLQLVNQVMDLSKLQAGKLELQAAPIQVNPLLEYIFSSFSSKAEEKDIDYQLFLSVQAVEIYLDEEKFQQIMGNLLSNACKFVQNGGKVHLIMEDRSEEVLIKVVDSGPGLSPLEQEHIFDPYYQTGGARQVSEAGTGIGLALSKELVLLHGGNIWVESKVGQGSTFTLALRKGRKHLQADQINLLNQRKSLDLTLPTALTTMERPTLSSKARDSDEELPLILVAEDEGDMRTYLQSILENKYRLILAENGKKALDMAQEQQPDLIISDIMMPEMDGMQFVESLKKHPTIEHIPLIFLSAKSGAESRLEGWEREAQAYLTKPFQARELLLIIESILKNMKRMQVRFKGEVILKPAEVAVNSREAIFLQKLTDYLEANLDNSELSIEGLAGEMAMSRSQLNRKLKALTGQSPTLFIRNFRLQRARQLLEEGYGNISEIADKVGISSPAYFSRIFSETFGKAPSEWTKK